MVIFSYEYWVSMFLYSWSSGFDSRPRDRLSWLVGFLIPSNFFDYFRTGHGCVFPHSFQFRLTNNLTSRPYIIVKVQLNKQGITIWWGLVITSSLPPGKYWCNIFIYTTINYSHSSKLEFIITFLCFTMLSILA